MAYEKGCKSILLHLISCGNYNIPKDLDIDIATNAISEFIKLHENMKIHLIIFDTEFYKTSDDLIIAIINYIRENQLSEIYFTQSFASLNKGTYQYNTSTNLAKESSIQFATPIPTRPKGAIYTSQIQQLAQINSSLGNVNNVDDLLSGLPEDSLGKLIKRLLKEKGIKDKEVYNRANLTNTYMSKLKNDKEPNPQKEKILALAVGMYCNLEETNELLYYAGYFFSPVKMWDLVVKWFVVKSGKCVASINVELEEVRQKLESRYGKLIG